MFDIITKGIVKVFGSKAERDLKELMPYVPKINEEYAKLRKLSDEQLRGRTAELKKIIASDLKEIDAELSKLHASIADNPELDINQKEDFFNEIDKLEKDRDKKLEETLLRILPQAFAVVKETAFRLKENGRLVVEATMMDRKLAAERAGIEINGNQAVWLNKWMAAGNEITWDMLHYDVQL
ncbi:MAG TPA: hypothetical protein VNW99_12645, partial [Cytophagaceae bacterium]|nr:hypothetical protein [Cytophagaceae bacterium]